MKLFYSHYVLFMVREITCQSKYQDLNQWKKMKMIIQVLYGDYIKNITLA
jgi:hypothetical protein